MKTIKIITATALLTLCISIRSYAQIKVTSTGTVGLRTTHPDPLYDVHIKGKNVWLDQAWPGIFSEQYWDGHSNVSCFRPGNDWTVWLGTPNFRWEQIRAKHITSIDIHLDINPIVGSDLRIKQNVREIENPLDKVLMLHGVLYDYKNDKLPKNNFGFIAQEVKEVLPEIVDYSAENDQYGVKYEQVIPLLVECVKQQQAEINALKELNNTRQFQQNPEGENTSANIDVILSSKTIVLNQNQPNPFKENTTIEYFIPDNSENVKIIFTDKKGSILNEVDLTERGKGTLTVYASDLSSGIYTYTIVSNGITIDSKNMVKNK